eukprot:SAG31_NODE_2512_length_5584_cov_19.499727_2_plen_165_part_00
MYEYKKKFSTCIAAAAARRRHRSSASSSASAAGPRAQQRRAPPAPAREAAQHQQRAKSTHAPTILSAVSNTPQRNLAAWRCSHCAVAAGCCSRWRREGWSLPLCSRLPPRICNCPKTFHRCRSGHRCKARLRKQAPHRCRPFRFRQRCQVCQPATRLSTSRPRD